VTASAQYILEEPVTRFESEFGGFVETEYAVGVGSGLDAITGQAAHLGPILELAERCSWRRGRCGCRCSRS
jgi:dTDP-4-amino-4,6-dideoxygalactose transaminase